MIDYCHGNWVGNQNQAIEQSLREFKLHLIYLPKVQCCERIKTATTNNI